MALTTEEILNCVELFNEYSNSNVPLVYDTNTKWLVNEAYAKFTYDRVKNFRLGADDNYTIRQMCFIKNLWKLLMRWLLDWLTPTPVVSPLLDIDGNEYTTVTIGTQEWIVQNLRTTHYADGSDIPNITSNGSATDYDDWFLPSKDELKEMHDELHAYSVGDFGNSAYWSSSENDATTVWCHHFGTNMQFNDYTKPDPLSVRACRFFTSISPSYSLRDVGPAGGLIFYKNGNDYLETAPTDTGINQAWSNVDDVAVTGTGTTIGTGQDNTTAIIGQVGHTASAAKSCNDYTIIVGDGWAGDTIGAYCWYNNDEVGYGSVHGALYNWYAIDNAKDLVYFERDNIEELGWRVPSEVDFNLLVSFINGGSLTGGILKETGITHWANPNTGALDSYGFKALGSGYRDASGNFLSINQTLILGSSYLFSPGFNYDIILHYDSSSLGSGYENTSYGLSVRCVRDIAISSQVTVDDTSVLSDSTIITVDNG